MEAIGPILLVLSLPLMLRWVPQNRVYGFRIPATLRDVSVWYDAILRIVGVVGLVALTVADWRTANQWERERNRRAADQR